MLEFQGFLRLARRLLTTRTGDFMRRMVWEAGEGETRRDTSNPRSPYYSNPLTLVHRLWSVGVSLTVVGVALDAFFKKFPYGATPDGQPAVVLPGGRRFDAKTQRRNAGKNQMRLFVEMAR
jgi:hypothetical protein